MSQNVDEIDLEEDYPSKRRKLLLTVISPTDLSHMHLLEVLDLSSTSIQSLPSCISSLSSLKELLLRDCSFLFELPIEIGMLSKLKLLDMEGSEIMYIPKEIVELTDLEVLRLCLSQYAEYYIKAKNVNGGVIVPRMMISKFKKLKELCISVHQEAEWWEKEIKEIQDEICHLENLEILKWYLPTDTTLKQFLDIQINRKPAYEKLSNFTFTIGQHAQLTSCLPRGLEKKFTEFENCLKWINAEGNIYDISKIMTRAKALFLSRHWTIVNLSAFDISKLKYFLLAECNEMETLVKIDGFPEVVENNKKGGLESLEYLSIHYMEKLKSIWEGPIGKDSLSRLRILALHTCLELTTIFTPRIAQNLSCLAELTVEECPKVRSLISTPQSEHGPLFPSLERIFLIDLPELDHIFGGLIVLEKLESLMIYNCVKLRHLSEMVLPRIQKIKGENKWWNSLNAYAPTWENVFEPLKEKSKLIKQLLEATNSLQHFHDVVSREAKDEKQLDGPGMGAQETKTDPCNFPLRKEEGRFHTLPEAKDKQPLNGPGLGAQETKTDPFNFPLRKEEGRFHTLPEAKDKKPLDGPGLGAQETKTDPYNFPLRKEEGLFHTLPEVDRNKRMKLEEKKMKGTLILRNNHFFASSWDELLGRKVSLQLVSAVHSESTAKGLRGKLGKETNLKNWGRDSSFELDFDFEEDIGIPGAFLIVNRHRSEFYLKTLTLEHVPNVGRVHFICNSWVYPEEHYQNGYRVFFSNQTYLPGKTPEGLRHFRDEELQELRGNGTGQREEWHRIYDYDVYNDLSEPDRGSEHVRPILGGSSEFPYPRRCRTGRAPSKTDPNMESRISILQSLNIYVPKDERFSDLKMADVYAYGIKLVSQGLLPGLESIGDKISDEVVLTLERVLHHKFESISSNSFNEFSSFEDVLKLYQGGLTIPKSSFLESVRDKIPSELFRELFRIDGQKLSKFPVPQVIKEDTSAWQTDEEFGRELLAGICPVVIRRLKEFPPTSTLDPRKFGNHSSKITEDHIKHQMDGFSVLEAIKNNRLFILDHHDPLMPFLRDINETSTKIYATRTILFLQNDGTLIPIAIELSLPHPDGDQFGAISTVHTPASEGTKGTLWLLAKAYANVNDSGYHQLICRWLQTHAAIEPFIIATNRQLSILHPIHKLLHPHFRDTMNINGLSRQTFINAGGLLEKTVYPDKYALVMSCNMYKKWDFTKQALPADLIDRGMAVEDASSPHGVRLLIGDYPFAVDGLEIWSAIKSWVTDYVFVYYKNDEDIQNDNELKSWWEEVRTKGHGDKKDEPWWPKMHTREELIESCTTIIWVASALHAAVNFGQYPYAGYMPNRPPLSRRLLPEPGTADYDELETNPEKAFLKTMTPKLQSILWMSLIEILSRHSADEVFLGERDTPEWTTDNEALEAFENFGANLREIEKKIDEMNLDKRFRNRTGPAQMPYTLLYPSSEIGLTGRGIPNSVSI